ncbi:MAG: hypothetical protein ACYCSS_14635 [Sulfuriferula sp.]
MRTKITAILIASTISMVVAQGAIAQPQAAAAITSSAGGSTPPTLTPQQLDELIADYRAATQPQAQQPVPAQRRPQPPTIAPWVILLRNAISTTASALWIAAIGFLVASIGIGMGALFWGRAQVIRARKCGEAEQQRKG